MDNFFLILLATLVTFFFVILFYSKNKINFGKINLSDEYAELKTINDVYHLDTRFEYPTVPPVNPRVYQSVVLNSVPVDKGLYSIQEMDNLLDQTNFNQLNYSGGTNELIKIPLQFNEPYDEQLRSQEILITPYNRIKYKVDC